MVLILVLTLAATVLLRLARRVVPLVLRNGTPHTLASFAGCWFYLRMVPAGANDPLALWTSAAFIVALRMIA